jgi:hypothetical protein
MLHGLAALPKMAAPRNIRHHVWPTVVADALRLADEGWATQALSMGWSALDLWGVGEEFEGVAVQLRGRPIRCLLEEQPSTAGATACFVLKDVTGTAYLNRTRDPTARLLWDRSTTA